MNTVPAHPQASHAPLLRGRPALILFVLALLAFAACAADLLLHGPLTAADAGISGWFHEHARPAFTTFMRGVSNLHSTASVLVITAVAAAVLLWRGERDWVLALGVCVPGGMVLNSLIKNLVQRPRPAFDHPLITIATYSFPSGHTATATVAWGFALVWVFAHRASVRERVTVSVLAVLMVVLTALSRIYLGAHYPSDVLAACAEGVAWLALCCFAFGRWCAQARGDRIPSAIR